MSKFQIDGTLQKPGQSAEAHTFTVEAKDLREASHHFSHGALWYDANGKFLPSGWIVKADWNTLREAQPLESAAADNTFPPPAKSEAVSK